jgi:hypothetical protein
MKIYVKPSGQEVEVNPNSYALAEELGWKLKQEVKQEEKKIPARSKKTEV